MQQALAFLVTCVIVGAPFLAGAQIEKIVPCDGLNCTVCDLGKLAQNVLNAAIYLSVFLSAFLFSYAGWLYISNEAIGQQQKAKALFGDVVIGLVIILGAWIFVDTLMKVLLGGSYLPWNSVCGTYQPSLIPGQPAIRTDIISPN